MKGNLMTPLVASMLISSTLVFAQVSPMMSAVHQDIVKPSMDVKYRELMQKLKGACEQYKTSFGWTTISYEDNSYRHIAPIKGFADLDKNPFADLEEKMGKEALAKLFAEFDACLESHSDFVMEQLPQFSYLSPAEGDNYRNATFWHPLPGKRNEVESILGEWKKLHESKKVPSGYLVIRNAFGELEEYVVVRWGKNALDDATKYQKTLELIGKDGDNLWLKTQAITKKISNKRGEYLPQFSYSAPK